MRLLLIFCFLILFSSIALADNIDYLPQENAKGENVSIFVSQKINPLQDQKALIVIDTFKDLGNAKLMVFSRRKYFTNFEIPLTDKKEGGTIITELKAGKRYFARWDGHNKGKPLEEGNYFLRLVNATGNILPEIAVIKIDWQLNEYEFEKEVGNELDSEKRINFFKDMKTKNLKVPFFIRPDNKEFAFPEIDIDININSIEVKDIEESKAQVTPNFEKTYKYYPNKFRKKEIFETVSNEEKNVIKKLELLNDFRTWKTFFKRAKTSFEQNLTQEENKALTKLIKEGIVYLGEPYILSIDATFNPSNTEEKESIKGKLSFEAGFANKFEEELILEYCPIEASTLRQDKQQGKRAECNIEELQKKPYLEIRFMRQKRIMLKPDKDTQKEYTKIELDLENVPTTTSYEIYFEGEKPFETRNSDLAQDALGNKSYPVIRVNAPISKFDEEVKKQNTDGRVDFDLCIKTINKDGHSENSCKKMQYYGGLFINYADSRYAGQQNAEITINSEIKLDEIELFAINSYDYAKILQEKYKNAAKKEIEKRNKKQIYHGYAGERYFASLNIPSTEATHNRNLLVIAKPVDEEYGEQYFEVNLHDMVHEEPVIVPKTTSNFFVERDLVKKDNTWTSKYRQRYLLDVTYHKNNQEIPLNSSVYNIEFLIDGQLVTTLTEERTLTTTRIRNLPLPQFTEKDLDKEHELCILFETTSEGEDPDYEGIRECKKFRINKVNLDQQKLKQIYEEQKRKWGCKNVKQGTSDLNILFVLKDYFDEDLPAHVLDEVIKNALYGKKMSLSTTIPFNEFFSKMSFWKMETEIYDDEDAEYEGLLKEYCPINFQNIIILSRSLTVSSADMDSGIVHIDLSGMCTQRKKAEFMMMHEFGHSLCLLSDEYEYGYEPENIDLTEHPNCFATMQECEKNYIKLVKRGKRGKKPWCFQVCGPKTLFRQLENSIMRDEQEPPYKFSPIAEYLCRERLRLLVSQK